MSNKTISINPSLFSIGGSKTKKNKEKPQKPIVPLISPNVLKNKLLKRIKEHKSRETSNLENNKTTLKESLNNTINSSILEEKSYGDEFNDSITYLQTLSKQKKVNEEKAKYDREKQRKREELERKTVKNYDYKNISDYSDGNYSTGNFGVMPSVNIDLPEELQQPLITISKEHLSNSDILPYGILKGGTKPTYRSWQKTQRNLLVTNPNSSLIIENKPIVANNERENRLNSLRDKLKLKQKENELLKMNTEPLTTGLSGGINDIPKIAPSTQMNESTDGINDIPKTSHSSSPPINEINGGTNSVPKMAIISADTPLFVSNNSNRLIKKTIKRKYTLGKSKLKKTVAVLLKDKGTRKKIINAQRDLKRKSINDVKVYLRDHNLIKVGSNAPNDVLRKIYETSMLAGEITNNNPENLLFNLIKHDKEL
jgi:hypothetical protein